MKCSLKSFEVRGELSPLKHSGPLSKGSAEKVMIRNGVSHADPIQHHGLEITTHHIHEITLIF